MTKKLEKSKERERERNRSTTVMKGVQREERGVGELRRDGHKKLEERLEAVRRERKLEKETGKDRTGETGTGERKKKEREVCKKGKVNLEEMEEKSKGRKDGEGGAIKKTEVAKKRKEKGVSKERR